MASPMGQPMGIQDHVNDAREWCCRCCRCRPSLGRDAAAQSTYFCIGQTCEAGQREVVRQARRKGFGWAVDQQPPHHRKR